MPVKRFLTRRHFLAVLIAGGAAVLAWTRYWRKLTADALRSEMMKAEAERLPPGQHWVDNLIEYTAGKRPEIAEDAWELTIDGLVENPLRFSLKEFRALPHREITEDFHCVTTWSVKDPKWRGVSLAGLIEEAKTKPSAAFVFAECYGGYSTNFPLSTALLPETLLADGYRGKPLEKRFRGPVRLVVPSLYAYKSAKWVKRISLLERDKLGFWEERGYSNQADPWEEQRWTRDNVTSPRG